MVAETQLSMQEAGSSGPSGGVSSEGYGRLRRRAHPRGLSDPVPRSLRQAARLSRQRGVARRSRVSVLEAMDHAYRFEYANVHRGLHYLSNTATAKFEEARETTRRFLNAGSIDEIIFTRNATSAINLVAQIVWRAW